MARYSVRRIFIDASVLFASCDSLSGASSLILGHCRKHKLQGCVSQYALSEARKNISSKLDQVKKQRLNIFVLQGNLKVVEEPTQEEIEKYKKVIDYKDAPILAAAIKSKTEYLVTLDLDNFFKPQVREVVKPMLIVTPGHFVKKVMKF